MGSRSKHKSHKSQPSRSLSGNTSSAITAHNGIWQPYEAYNDLEAGLRAAALTELGINAEDSDVLGILTKSHFVIPGKTRFECQQCGECCRYARRVAQLTYEACPFLTDENKCAKHDSRYIVCKWFPFWIYNDPVSGPLLTIKPYCSGYGKGPVVDYQATLERIQQLSVTEANESDGAFVIHEVLLVPGRKDWAFPSKRNVDELMAYIQSEHRKQVAAGPFSRPIERTGEVHYAHHYTSGLLCSINDPLLTIDRDCAITDINDAACELIKCQRADLIGKPFYSLFANPERVFTGVTSCFSRGKETAFPARMCVSDASPLPVLLNGLTYRDRSDGLVHGALISVVAVTATVFSDISQSQDYARGLIEASLDAFMVIDRDGVITDVNKTVEVLSGQPREALIGNPFKNLFVEPDKASDGVDLAFRTGDVRNYELTLVGAEGELVPVSFNASLYIDAEGVIQGIFASARDIRERLKMVQELEETKNYARGLIECCLDLMVTIDRNGIITDCNNAASVITGQEKADLVGATFKDFFDDPERAKSGVEQTFAEGAVRNYELTLNTATGTAVPVSFNATLYQDSHGEVKGVFAIARTRD